MQARTEEVGQSLLRGAYDRDTSAFGPLRRKRQRSSRTCDAYEEHLLLLEDRVVVLTDRAIVCILAPGFATVHAEAETGRLLRAPEIKNAQIRWAVVWEVGTLVCLHPVFLGMHDIVAGWNPSLECTSSLLNTPHGHECDFKWLLGVHTSYLIKRL